MDITSFVLGLKMGKSSGGGGADNRVKYVTFKYNGVELIKYPVVSGDTCHDPVNKGYIDMPTKEQTETTVYTWGGWSLTEGGAVDDSALTNVTSNRTVYAAFDESPRIYTVYFYDGETLIHSEQVAYGGSSSYTYSKDNYVFNGWLPEPTNVTSDMHCYAQMEEGLDFAKSSWDKIAAACESGHAADNFEVGQTRTITLSNVADKAKTFDVVFRIIDINRDTLASGGTVGLTIESVVCLHTTALMVGGTPTNAKICQNDSGSTCNYSDGQAHYFLNNDFITKCLPSDLRSYVKTIIQHDDYANIDFETKAFVLSAKEYGKGGQSEEYAYYKSSNQNSINAKSVMETTYMYGGDPYTYVTRTRYNSSGTMETISADTGAYGQLASSTTAIYPVAFCI